MRGKGRKPVKGEQMNVLSWWATEAQLLWGPLTDYMEHNWVWKLEFLSINSHFSVVEVSSRVKKHSQAERCKEPQAEWDLTAINLQGVPQSCEWGTNSFC